MYLVHRGPCLQSVDSCSLVHREPAPMNRAQWRPKPTMWLAHMCDMCLGREAQPGPYPAQLGPVQAQFGPVNVDR